ncbi:MAG: preprotein translocase subunit SecG [Phycisphaeraceae bacterium]|nr:MAG: preprotein translocase subunit SecG [Phycisphaeraceae bacterium]
MTMNMLTFAWSPALTAVLVVLFVLVCIMLILTVLIQRPQGGGLGGAFGGAGAGSGQTAFGAKTGDALTIGTIGIFILYLITAVVLNYAIAPGAPVPQEMRPVGDDAPVRSGEPGPLTIPIDPEAGFGEGGAFDVEFDLDELPDQVDPSDTPSTDAPVLPEEFDLPPADDDGDDEPQF